MKFFKFRRAHGLTATGLSAACALLVICAAAQVASAQAGRRGGGGARPPSTAPAETEKGKVSLLITYAFAPEIATWARPEDFMDGLIERLEASPSVKARRAGKMRRQEALDRAREETEALVIWVRLEERAPDPRARRTAVGQLGQLAVELLIFNPGTGEVRSQENVFSQITYSWLRDKKDRKSQTGSTGPQARVDDDKALPRAGRETADRIFKVLELSIPL